jgi:RNA-splicing ligase RtcB
MLHTITGGATSAIVYGDYPDQNELTQIFSLLSCPAFAGANVRIMPDHHAGSGCVIGFTSSIDMTDPKIVPNVVGVDIGCGVTAIQLPSGPTREEHFAAFDRFLRSTVPAGFNVRPTVSDAMERVYREVFGVDPVIFEYELTAITKKIGIDDTRVLHSIGTLGGGNHFIELDRSDDASVWLTVHSGSRNFGLQVANYHQRKAQASHPFGALSWLSGDDALEYLSDMRLCQQFARLNRALMLYLLSDMFVNRAHVRMALVKDAVESVHNYISDDNVIRKGAVSAEAGTPVIIPWNMRDGIVIGVGRGNADWNMSAPHGAGRRMGRREAKNTLSVADYKAAMEGIWSSCVGKSTIDEAPDAYKPAESVEAALVDTVEVQHHLKPIYNFKAGEESR